MKQLIFFLLLACMIGVCHGESPSFRFDKSGITRPVLENYLKRSITMAEFLSVDPYTIDGPYPYKEDDIRLIKNIEAKFIGRAIYRWGREDALTVPDYLEQAKKMIREMHAFDDDIVFQAALFEIVTQNVNKISIPEWAFKALELPVESRNFYYNDMLNVDGKMVDHWGKGASVPDITRKETRLWFIFLAGTYFNVGCEALHLGQTALIGMVDHDLSHWKAFISRLRAFAGTTTRRGWVLLDAHVPTGGMVVDGVSLLDFNTFPLRIREIPEMPQQAVLKVGYLDALFRRSKGCVTPSGWECRSLPYLVEFDNFGCSKTPGNSTIDSHFIWGYDEITWFCLQSEDYRQQWLQYAYEWVRENDPDGFLQMPVSRVVSFCEGKGRGRYRANTRSSDNPDGLNVEETIKKLWASQSNSVVHNTITTLTSAHGWNDGQAYQNIAQTTVLRASERKTPIDAGWVDRAEFFGKGEKPGDIKNVLWYRRSAVVWEEALPLGNGRFGAMVFGGVADERIQLNENTMWDGFPVDPNNPAGREALPEVRRLLFEDKNNEAVRLAESTMMGDPRRIKSYQSLGELWFDTPGLVAYDYVRSLDLSTAVSTVKYKVDGVNHTREYFASSPDNVIVVRITTDKSNMINLSLTLKRAQDAETTGLGNDGLLMSGRIATNDKDGNPRGVSFAAQVKAVAEGGTVEVTESLGHEQLLKVKDANTLTLFITGATDYPGMKSLAEGVTITAEDPVAKCAQTITKVVDKPYGHIKADHIADHRKFFERVDIDFGTIPAETESLPTDERLALARKTGKPDPGLVATYFQFGRYLLIGSSRPGEMPANLQGLWAWQMKAPWNADFHTNINFQMNYWPADLTNLSEMHGPLFDLMDMLVKPGERSADVIYGARGWVVHHLTDAWGFTAPADGPQGIWPMGAAWLAQHPWDHYCFTGDKEFLAKRAWPLMKGAARFIIDFLVEAPEGTAYAGMLVTNPSYSPENAFILPNGEHSVFTYGATMDIQIIHNLLTNCIEAAKVLKVDADFRKECEATLKRIPDIRISEKTGRILEWAEDYKEVDPHHRHTSHLFGLCPGNQITVVGTPQLAEAARKTLIARGGGGTGWGLAWKINMWNRLHDGDHAFELLSVLMGRKTLPNLFDDHPPFQIDGNFGATAAIAEMLVQSHLKKKNGSFEVHLLPSLPSAMENTGSVRGLKARGGLIIDLAWEKGQLTRAKLYSRQGGKVYLRTGDSYKSHKMKKGEVIIVDGNLTVVDRQQQGRSSDADSLL